MKKYNLTATVWRETEGYVAKCPELGVASAGDTQPEALDNLKEAVELYLENAVLLDIFDDIAPAIISPDRYSSVFEVTA